MNQKIIILKTNLPIDAKAINQDIILAKANELTYINHGNELVATLFADAEKACYMEDIAAIEWSKATKDRHKVVFLFTGQGSQYINMGLDLYQNNKIFKSFFDQAITEINKHLEINLLDIIFPKSECNLINQTNFTQPALFALEYALAKTWMEYGIQPNIVMGHSVGEFAAATIAGSLSLSTGAALISNRAKLMQQLPTGGSMAALMADIDTTKKLISSLKNKFKHIGIAAINAPKQTVISGEIRAVRECIELAKKEKIKSRELVVSHAFHSTLMQPMLDEFTSTIKTFSAAAPTIPLISNLTGDFLTTAPNAKYWCEHILNPVNFLSSIDKCNFANTTFIEIGPSPILVSMAKKCISKENILWLESINNSTDDSLSLLSNIAQAKLQC